MNKDSVFGLLGVLACLCLGLILFSMAGWRDEDKRPLGSAGLAEWLRANEVDVRYENRTLPGAPDESFRILPIADLDLQNEIKHADEEERLRDGQWRDIWWSDLWSRIEADETLVIVPKWKLLASRAGVAAKETILPAHMVQPLLQDMELKAVILRPSSVDLDYNGRKVDLYMPQLLRVGDDCVPLIGTSAAMLLGRCKGFSDADYWVLSDPDLLNNHGLGRGDNAALAIDLLTTLANGRQIVVDVNSEFEPAPEAVETYSRTSDDLRRFVEYPFSLAWIGVLAFAILGIWRGMMRIAPARAAYDDQPDATKDAFINARAHLLDLTGRRATLLQDYVTARFAAEATRIWGPVQRPKGALSDIMVRHIRRQDADAGARMAGLLNELDTLPETLSSARMAAFAQSFEQTLEVLHDPR